MIEMNLVDHFSQAGAQSRSGSYPERFRIVPHVAGAPSWLTALLLPSPLLPPTSKHQRPKGLMNHLSSCIVPVTAPSFPSLAFPDCKEHVKEIKDVTLFGHQPKNPALVLVSETTDDAPFCDEPHVLPRTINGSTPPCWCQRD